MRQWIAPKRVLIALLSCSFSSAYAVGAGFYLGPQLGPVTNDASTQSVLVANPPGPPGATTIAKPKSSQFGSKFLMGYQINRFAAVEGGFAFYSPIKYTSNLPPENELRSRVRYIDFSGKGILPFGSYFDVFLKGGVAATYVTLAGGFNTDGKNKEDVKFRPIFGVGASYNISQNWVTDISWTRLLVGSIVNNMDFYAVGISYHFVDKYCGQFLCDD